MKYRVWGYPEHDRWTGDEEVIATFDDANTAVEWAKRTRMGLAVQRVEDGKYIWQYDGVN